MAHRLTDYVKLEPFPYAPYIFRRSVRLYSFLKTTVLNI